MSSMQEPWLIDPLGILFLKGNHCCVSLPFSFLLSGFVILDFDLGGDAVNNPTHLQSFFFFHYSDCLPAALKAPQSQSAVPTTHLIITQLTREKVSDHAENAVKGVPDFSLIEYSINI